MPNPTISKLRTFLLTMVTPVGVREWTCDFYNPSAESLQGYVDEIARNHANEKPTHIWIEDEHGTSVSRWRPPPPVVAQALTRFERQEVL